MLITGTTQAYINHGRWVVDCGRQYCGNAEALAPNQATYVCAGHGACGWQGMVEWPHNAQELMDALNLRPVPATRNWFPHGHELGMRCGAPLGQSVQELIDEQKLMENIR